MKAYPSYNGHESTVYNGTKGDAQGHAGIDKANEEAALFAGGELENGDDGEGEHASGTNAGENSANDEDGE